MLPPPSPLFPPIGEDAQSRLLFLDLNDTTADLLRHRDASAWMLLSAGLLESKQGFPDTALVEGMWLQEKGCRADASIYDQEQSRSEVVVGSRADMPSNCAYANPEGTYRIYYRSSACLPANASFSEEYDLLPHPRFQPRCLVLLIEASSRRELLNELVEAGRDVADPLRVEVNYSVALAAEPDLLVAAQNCDISHVLHENHMRDAVGQELELAISEGAKLLEERKQALQLYEETARGLSQYRPPAAPPPPPPGFGEPPAPPAPLTIAQHLQAMRADVDALERDQAALRAQHRDTSGRSLREAPDPWVSASGAKCVGHDTREALVGAYCAHWSSTHNVDAAEASEQEALLDESPPWCYSADEPGSILDCSPVSDRAARAGVYEVAEWTRPDRYYCASRVFRDLVLGDASTEDECVLEIRSRNASCYRDVCEPCTSACTTPWLQTAFSVVSCVTPSQHLAFVYALQVSDAGQLARASHGAIRGEAYIPVPENLAAHAYAVFHNNREGYIQRDAVSCRKETRESPQGHFVAGFDAKTGNPVARTGFMVSCARTSDCAARCPVHPLTGDRYVCMKTYKLYDAVRITGGMDPDNPDQMFKNPWSQAEFLQLDTGEGVAFDPDATAETGICVDVDYRLFQGCTDEFVARAVDMVGCVDEEVGIFLCGIELEMDQGDPRTVGVALDFEDLTYPRVLLEGGIGGADGLAVPRVTCSDPVDCLQKCKYLERTSQHGMGAPPACALCNQYCPSNIISTAKSIITGIRNDVMTVVRLLGSCFGGSGVAGCLCNLLMILEPEWRSVAPAGSAQRCEDGDAVASIMNGVLSSVQVVAEDAVNWLGSAVNFFIPGSRNKIPSVCMPTASQPGRCRLRDLPGQDAARLEACESADLSGGLQNLCYFARVSQICNNAEARRGYEALFDSGYLSGGETRRAFAEAVGESFDALSPAIEALVRQVEISAVSGPDLHPRKRICESQAYESAMGLDMIIQSCIFELIEDSCPRDDGLDKEDTFSYMIEEATFELPKVRFDYTVDPPPPPPLGLKPQERVAAEDAEGAEIVRKELEALFPRLSDVATSSMGATVGSSLAPFDVSPQQLTRAYLATLHMEPDTIGARVLQAQYTGRWVPACEGLARLFSDSTLAVPGSLSASGTEDSPMRYDRNLFLQAMLQIHASMDAAAQTTSAFNSIKLYDKICGRGVGGTRSPTTPDNYETYDLGDGDYMDAFAPIVAYGSLEQLRGMLSMGYALACYDTNGDIAASIHCGAEPVENGEAFFADEMKQRQSSSPFRMQRDRVCNPLVPLSLEDMLEGPLPFTQDLKDTSTGIGRGSGPIDDLVAHYTRRGQERLGPQTGLRSWVYVTSSTDASVPPGLHRLLDLPVFDERGCASLPGVACSSGPDWTDPSFAALIEPFRAIADSQSKFWKTYIAQHAMSAALTINDELLPSASLQAAVSHEREALYFTGRQMFLSSRCSALVEREIGAACTPHPYRYTKTGCTSDDLAWNLNPTIYASEYWLDSLMPPPDPPPPSPKPPPSPPHPPPPAPYPPPMTTVHDSASIHQIALAAERRACSSVYLLPSRTRCLQLASDLHNSYVYATDAPPSPPPIPPTPVPHPPCPLTPPSPRLPEYASLAPIASAQLSTIRIPLVANEGLLLAEDGYTGDDLNASVLSGTPRDRLASCASGLGGTVPCVSASDPGRCLSAGRSCAVGVAQLLRDPFLRIQLDLQPKTRMAMLWAVRIHLPITEELASLFYRSVVDDGGVGYELTVYRPDGSRVPCRSAATQMLAVDATAEREIVHVCPSGLATDEDMYALSEASHVEIVLPGTARQIWIKRIDVVERSIGDVNLEPRSPRPPPLPRRPPSPPPTFTCNCTFLPGAFEPQFVATASEPCGWNAHRCCVAAIERRATAFAVNGAGCCTLGELSSVVNLSQVPDDLGPGAGMGHCAGSGLI